MRSSMLSSLSIISLLWRVSLGLAQGQSPAPALKAMTPVGCFSSSESLQDQGSYTFQSSGYCQLQCVTKNKAVMAMTGGSNCWCGDLLPAAGNQVGDDHCNIPCNGYDKEHCGGDKTWTVLLTGLKAKVDNAGASNSGDSSSDSSGSPTSPPSQGTTSTRTASAQVITVGGQTQTVTASGQGPTPTSSDVSKSSGSSSPNKAGIAAGVVVGVVALGALAGGLFFFIRMRRRRAVEEEYRRNAEINRFTGGKEGSTSSVSDSRLDPSVMQRRMSDGSIADNQDYSRRILKVTNPDGT